MRKNFNFCPQCSKPLTTVVVEEHKYKACGDTACGFIHFNNPVPVVAALIWESNQVVLVKRGAAPFVGRWCLPRGYLQEDENPKGAIVREVREETGLQVLLLRLLNACNPSPANFPLNQCTLFYLATVRGGALEAGSDAQDVGLFSPDALPDICFGSDIRIIKDWVAGIHGTIEQPVNFLPPHSAS